LETVQRDYAPKGVDFYYIYKPLAHPEYYNYVNPVTIEERLMHVAEAKRRLGSSVSWLADTMDSRYYNSTGRAPNSEMVIGPDGRVLSRRTWSDPAALRADLERFVGPVDDPTTIADLDLPTQPPLPTAAKGIVPRIEKPSRMFALPTEPVVDDNGVPFYAKLRAEADPSLLRTGKGQMYIGFHLDPLYEMHWNNEAGPVRFSITSAAGATVTPSSGVGPDLDQAADADPREFLVEVAMEDVTQPLDLDLFYFVCDDAITFCIPVKHSYKIYTGERHEGYFAIQTGSDNLPEADLDYELWKSNAPTSSPASE